jgi:hypothetical protein
MLSKSPGNECFRFAPLREPLGRVRHSGRQYRFCPLLSRQQWRVVSCFGAGFPASCA